MLKEGKKAHNLFYLVGLFNQAYQKSVEYTLTQKDVSEFKYALFESVSLAEQKHNLSFYALSSILDKSYLSNSMSDRTFYFDQTRKLMNDFINSLM